MKRIIITKNSNCYEQVNSLIIIMAALAISLDYRKSGAAIYKPGEHIALEGMSIKVKIKLPLFGPIEAVLLNKKPTDINIEIVELDNIDESRKLVISVLEETIYYIFMPIFVNFYENNSSHFEELYGNNYDLWPNSWRMAWVVRNAMAHNGKIYFNNPKTLPINWNCITISPIDQNNELKKFLNFTDTFILLFDMEESLKH